MSDPATQTNIAVAVGVSSAAGTFMGIEYAILLMALLGAAIAHIYLDKMPIKQMLCAMFGSFILGVVAAKFSIPLMIVATVTHFAPWLQDALESSKAERGAVVAFIVSFTAQKTVPILFNWLDKRKGQ